MSAPAIVLANDHFRSVFAKTTHGLVRGPSRYRIVGIVDATCAGEDAGMLLDGRSRGIPVFASFAEALDAAAERPTHCVVGVATVGGVLPPALYADLTAAASAGLTLVNGLHHLLGDDPTLVRLAETHGGGIIDIRRPRPASELRFWTGEVLSLQTPRVAVLGTDCAVGKRTTAMLMRQALRARGVRAELIYTGQTGWLQGLTHGFIFDATLNDFVAGELEGAILACHRETQPDVILLEGQSALRNPAGPTGSEFFLSAGAAAVILQHMPVKTYFEDLEHVGCRIPALEDEIALIRMLGADVLAVTLNPTGLSPDAARAEQARLAESLGLPVVLPLTDGLETLVDLVQRIV